MTEQPGLEPPAVPPSAYDEDYFLNCCAGHHEWRESGGKTVAGVYPGALALAKLKPGETLLDVGTGRGELLAVAVEQGAERAVGVEYAQAGVELARRTLASHGVGERAQVIQADARDIPLEDGFADIVTMLDFVEHLTHAELHDALVETLRLLKPGGRVLVHTLPNRTIYEVTYRLQRLLVPTRLRSWPADPRNEYERLMHVGEHSVGSLGRALQRAGFADVRSRPGMMIWDRFVPSERARKTYRRLAKRRPTARLGAADVWAEARRAA